MCTQYSLRRSKSAQEKCGEATDHLDMTLAIVDVKHHNINSYSYSYYKFLRDIVMIVKINIFGLLVSFSSF